MYIADLIIWLLNSLFESKGCEIYNIGSDDPISISELAKKVNEFGKNQNKIYIEDLENKNLMFNFYVPSTEKIRNKFFFRMNYTLVDSIRKTLNYYQELK